MTAGNPPGMITLDHTAFCVAVADVRRAADQLRIDRTRVAREVDALLDGSWTGPAASAYAEGWENWKAAADTVLHGLAAMGELLDAARVGLTESDSSSGSAIDRLAVRLG